VTTIGLHKNNTHKLHFASKVQKAIKKKGNVCCFVIPVAQYFTAPTHPTHACRT